MILNEDCLGWMRRQDDNIIDVIVTSPPYNINIKYNTYADKKDDYTDWMVNVWEESFRILKSTGHLFLNIQPTRKNPLMPYEIISKLSWKIQNTFIWNKCIEIDGYVRGQGNASRSEKYLPSSWEYVFHLTENGVTPISQERSGVPYRPEWAEGNAKRNGGKTWRPTTNTWFIPYETVGNGSKSSKFTKGDKKHPAIFPKELVRKCLNIADVKSYHTVYDPFGGTGTTSVVAKEMGCKWITTEIDKDYVAFMIERCSNASD